MRSISDSFERTMFRVEFFNINEHKHARSLKAYKGRVLLLETLMMLQNTILLPFQIIGKPLAFISAKLCPNSCKGVYEKFPKSLIKSFIKIIALPLILVLTSMIIWHDSHLIFKMSCVFGLVDKQKQSKLVTKWYKKHAKSQELQKEYECLQKKHVIKKFESDHYWQNDSYKKRRLKEECNELTKQVFATLKKLSAYNIKLNALQKLIDKSTRNDPILPEIAYDLSDLNQPAESSWLLFSLAPLLKILHYS